VEVFSSRRSPANQTTRERTSFIRQLAILKKERTIIVYYFVIGHATRKSHNIESSL